MSALAALALAGWVALTIVPVLARRTPLRWLTYQIDYKLTREGGVYLAGIFVVALAALNTGNNLLFMVLGCLLAGVLVSGLLSRQVLSGIEVRLALPEHIFAERAVMAIAELHNSKQLMPSFSVSLVSEEKPKSKKNPQMNAAPRILDRPIYFPHIPHQQTVRQDVELTFPRRGIYRQDVLGLRTKFPFGFLQKTRQIGSEIEALVYPAVHPTGEFYEILPLLSGELESFQRGRGNDLYGIRDYSSMKAPGTWIGRRRPGPARCRCANTRARTNGASCWRLTLTWKRPARTTSNSSAPWRFAPALPGIFTKSIPCWSSGPRALRRRA